MFKVQTGRKVSPLYGIITGEPGVGKSSFIAGRTDQNGNRVNGAPSPVVIGPENNSELDCLKLPKPETFEELKKQVMWILSGGMDSHKIRTVGIDSLDFIEKLIHKDILSKHRAPSIDQVGQWGEGRKMTLAMLTEFQALAYRLVIEKNLNVWYTAHCVALEVTDPELGSRYQRYEMSLHKSKKMDASKIFSENVSTVLFATNKKYLTEDGFAKSTEQRVLYTESRPGHLAKNRYSLPYEIPLDYGTFSSHVRKFYGL